MEKKKILIIEDEHGLANAIDTQLREAGFDTMVAYDGMQAKEIIKTQHFDLVLLDLIMPVIDGWQVLNELYLHSLRTVVISNLSGSDNIARAKERGAEDYIEKADTSLEDLVKKVVALVEQKFPETKKT